MVRLVSFNAFRSLGIPNVTYLKPEHLFRERELVRTADWVLFPEYWQINALTYGLGCRIFPSVNSYHLGHNKIEMTRALWAIAPEHVPDTEIYATGDGALEEILERFDLPLVAKTVKSSRGEGVFLIEDRAALRHYCATHEVIYIQEYLPVDRDLRVVFVGDRVLTAYWRIGREGVFQNNVARGAEVCFDHIPPAAITLVERIARQLGINHAGFDLVEVNGHFYILEFNTLFGNQALNERGIRVEEAIQAYLGDYDREPPSDTPQLPEAI